MREIYLESPIEERLRLLRAVSTSHEKINLKLWSLNHHNHDFRFSETVELRELILGMKSNIYHLDFCNGWQNDRNEYLQYFNYFVNYLRTNRGKTQNFSYWNKDYTLFSMSLEQGKQLANAIKNNNNNSNNNNAINNFRFCDSNLNFVAFQPVLDAILDSGVQKLDLRIHGNDNININNNNNINFTALSTNISIRELYVIKFRMSPQDRMIFYDAIKINKTLGKLKYNLHRDDVLEETEKNSFKAMLQGNITLTNITLCSYMGYNNQLVQDTAYDDLREKIVIHTELNRMWNRYKIMIREAKVTAVAAAAATAAATSNYILTNVEEKNKKIQEEHKMVKKKEEMVICLKIFDSKPLIRNELLFSYLKNHTDQYIQD